MERRHHYPDPPEFPCPLFLLTNNLCGDFGWWRMVDLMMKISTRIIQINRNSTRIKRHCNCFDEAVSQKRRGVLARVQKLPPVMPMMFFTINNVFNREVPQSLSHKGMRTGSLSADCFFQWENRYCNVSLTIPCNELENLRTSLLHPSFIPSTCSFRLLIPAVHSTLSFCLVLTVC